MPKPTDYILFYLRASQWKGDSLRFFAKRETNEQTYDKSPGPVIHVTEPENWVCCKKKLRVRNFKGDLQKCGWCLKTFYDPKD